MPDLDASTIEMKRPTHTKRYAIAAAVGASALFVALLIAFWPEKTPPPPPMTTSKVNDAGVEKIDVVEDPPIEPISPAKDKEKEKPRVVETLAPPYVSWETDNGKRLGKGNGKITVPAGERVVFAVDTKTGGKSELPVSSKLDYNSVGKGTLQLNGDPPADIVMGSVKLGKTPQSLLVPAGSYKVKFIRGDKTTEKRVVVRKGATTKVSP
jgi:hypothetical protein